MNLLNLYGSRFVFRIIINETDHTGDEQIINDYTPKLKQTDPGEFSDKPFPLKWSKKEMLGHLIDSAQNNIRRFVVAQHEKEPHIVYAQDNWVMAADYRNYPNEDLVNLWVLLNKHIVIILKNLPAGAEKRKVKTGELHTIEWLAEDYNKHLLHHLHQVLNLEDVPYA